MVSSIFVCTVHVNRFISYIVLRSYHAVLTPGELKHNNCASCETALLRIHVTSVGSQNSITYLAVSTSHCLYAGADPGVEIGGGHMASAEREPIMGVWGLCPQRGPGAEP